MITENNTLQTLILSHNKFSDQSAVDLTEGLKSNQSIKVLDLSYNSIGDIGAIALGKCFSQNETLKDVNLSYNEIRPRGSFINFLNLGLSAFLNGAKVSSMHES